MPFIHLRNPLIGLISDSDFFIYTTKGGQFRGKQEHAHDVDVIIEVADGKAKGNGRFGIGWEIDVW